MICKVQNQDQSYQLSYTLSAGQLISFCWCVGQGNRRVEDTVTSPDILLGVRGCREYSKSTECAEHYRFSVPDKMPQMSLSCSLGGILLVLLPVSRLFLETGLSTFSHMTFDTSSHRLWTGLQTLLFKFFYI